MSRTSQVLLVAMLLTLISAVAVQAQTNATSNPLLRLLESKGILTQQEAAAVS